MLAYLVNGMQQSSENELFIYSVRGINSSWCEIEQSQPDTVHSEPLD